PENRSDGARPRGIAVASGDAARGSPAIMTSDGAAEEARRPAHWRRLLLRGVLILVLLLVPLPLASVNATAWSSLALASGLLLLLAFAVELGDPAPREQLAALLLPAIPAAVVALWIVLQQFPAPFPDWNTTIWSWTAHALGTPVETSISLARGRSLGHLLRLLTYAAIFLAAWTVGRRSRGAQTVLATVAIIGAAYALYGLASYFSGNHFVLWFRKTAYTHDLTGSFVNRNSFATFLGLCLVANIGVLARVLSERVDPRTWRTLFHSAVEAAFRQGLWPLLGATLTASALLLTHSRGGMIATLCGVAALVLAVLSAPSLRGPWRWPLAAFAAAGAILMIVLTGSGVLERLGESREDATGRSEIYAGTIAAIKEFPISGTGLGSFEYVFPPFQSQSELQRIEYAHDEYLQTALELGIPAALAFFAALAILAGRCIHGAFRRRRNALFPCVGIGASVLAAAHSLVDFSLEIPAVTAIYAALLGMAVAQSVGTSAAGRNGRRR
ncbi:MAG TPA: O-antigen ligase family protein, partial [Stellaceae bacterium]|nr:O-antigen ligase family protein [Stellaceae bacterium]